MGGFGVLLVLTTHLASFADGKTKRCGNLFMKEVSKNSSQLKYLFLKPYREYKKVQERFQERPDNFFDAVLNHLNIDIKYSEKKFAAIPEAGPLVVVANHPMGAIDGVILFKLLLEKRSDVKAIISSKLYEMIPELQAYTIPLDVHVGDFKKSNQMANKKAIVAMNQHVKNGGALIVFPSGEMSTAEYPWRTPYDSEWKTAAALVAMRHQANVLPVYFETTNSRIFQATGMLIKNHRADWLKNIGYKLRTDLLLPYQIINKRDHQIPVALGSVLSPRDYDAYISRNAEGKTKYDDQGFTDFLRAQTYLLGNTAKYSKTGRMNLNVVARIKERPKKKKNLNQLEAIIEPVDPKLIAQELERFRALDQAGEKNDVNTQYELSRLQIPRKINGIRSELDISIFLLPGNASEPILTEIGRLREEAFRPIKEGTGKSLDLDIFDPYYHQMIVYRNDTQEILGAYRLGFTEKLLNEKGIESLYSHSLFGYQRDFVDKLGHSVELGRSFVSRPYQIKQEKAATLGRKLSVLNLLWMGLAEIAYQNGQIQSYFGPVTISGSFGAAEKKMIMQFLMQRYGDPSSELQKYVPDYGKLKEQTWMLDRIISNVLKSVHDINELNQLFLAAGLEEIPPLLKQYAKHGARFYSFKDDKDFNTGDTATYATDGLIVVSLKDVPQDFMKRLLGEEKARVLEKRLN
tara:strand:+ start:17364 stop:19430 length:2067 start_codon:yes stop_codon:yes gene_type:complete